MIAHYDCRHFLGYKPCVFKRECDGCSHYSPYGKRILIIKLAAMGDVLRTTPILRGLKKACPDCNITWLTEPNVLPMLQGISEIDRLLAYNSESVLQLETESFAEVYCFDKEPRATGLVMRICGERKVGFGMSPFGNVMPLNRESEYVFELGINDPLKFRLNNRTYPELIFECAGLHYPEPQEYIFPDLSAEIEEARSFLQSLGVRPGSLRVGLNTGAGDIFATKKWTEEGYAELASRLIEDFGVSILLLGGPCEVERNARIAEQARFPLINTGNDNSIRRFCGIIGNCDLVVTGDTLAMHLAIGLKVPVLLLLGATCHQELELYGRGAKVISDFDCSPCYLNVCPREISCMQAMRPEVVYKAAARLIGKLGNAG
jgi:ADP-heptose:LPS heptosyltransferase